MLSMTGYGNLESENNKIALSMELKSINSKYFETHIRLPALFSNQEQKISNILKKRLIRGRVSFNLNYQIKDMNDNLYSIDQYKFDNFVSLYKDLNEKLSKYNQEIKISELIDLDNLVTSKVNLSDNEIIVLLYESLDEVIEKHLEFRSNEGISLSKDILESIENILKAVLMISDIWDQKKDEYFSKYFNRIDKIIDKYKLNNDRLFQEVAIILDKRDINEEIIRLNIHLESFKNAVKNEQLLGKKLTFIVQEMFREINTISSKSEFVQINEKVIDIKSELEKIKEQIQNIL